MKVPTLLCCPEAMKMTWLVHVGREQKHRRAERKTLYPSPCSILLMPKGVHTTVYARHLNLYIAKQ